MSGMFRRSQTTEVLANSGGCGRRDHGRRGWRRGRRRNRVAAPWHSWPHNTAFCFVGITPVRVLDTRPPTGRPHRGGSSWAARSGQTIDVAVAGIGGIPAEAVSVANVTIDKRHLEELLDCLARGEPRPRTGRPTTPSRTGSPTRAVQARRGRQAERLQPTAGTSSSTSPATTSPHRGGTAAKARQVLPGRRGWTLAACQAGELRLASGAAGCVGPSAGPRRRLGARSADRHGSRYSDASIRRQVCSDVPLGSPSGTTTGGNFAGRFVLELCHPGSCVIDQVTGAAVDLGHSQGNRD